MLTAAKLLKFFADRDREVLKFLKQRALVDDEPEPEPEPPKPKPKLGGPKSGSQEWYRQLPPPRTDDDVITMNELARSVPKPKPPRKPSWER